MQNRYVGDIGDYIKYALLRALIQDEQDCALGVAWYLYPDESNNDGRHTGYLHAPEKWESLDEELFGCLRKIVCCEQRREVAAIEESGILENAVFYNHMLVPDKASRDYAGRESFREQWFECLKKKLSECRIVFADPDNGLADEGYRWGTQKHWKRMPLREAKALAQERVGVFYHHFAHKNHDAQIEHWTEQLGGKDNVCAVRWGCVSPRAFFVVNPSEGMPDRLRELESHASCIKNSKGKPCLKVV